MIRYKKDTSNIVVLTLDMANRKNNIINHEVGRAFIPVLAHLNRERKKGELTGVIITSAKQSFLSGGDLKYLYESTDVQDIHSYVTKLMEVFRSLERLQVPVVAAINGTALGSGFELCLATHHRVCINDPEIRLGSPEVTLGLMPGGGGLMRTLWMVGILKSMEILTKGRLLNPLEAREINLVDELAYDRGDMMRKARNWIENNSEPRQKWDTPNTTIPGLPADDLQVRSAIALAAANLYKETRGNYPAPLKILETIVEGASLSFESAIRVEGRNFTELIAGKTAKNLMKAFWFDFNAIKAASSRPKGYGRFRPQRIGVIGAGMMGSGIAFISAKAGLKVILKDVSKPIADKGKQYSAKLLEEEVQAGILTEDDKEQILKKIQTTENASDFEDCDLIIEAVFENRMIKGQVTREADKFLHSETVFASNTSTIPITDLSKASLRPENFIGMHFFSPVEKMELVEIIKGEHTSRETLARAFDFVKQVGKTPIVVNDSRGFYTTRVLNRFILEGLALLKEGQLPSTIEQVSIMAGMPVGPLALSDEVSISLLRDIETQAERDLGDAYEMHPGYPVMLKMVEELNRPGKAKKGGFYEYPQSGEKYIWEGLNYHFPPSEKPLDIEVMRKRILFAQALEAVRCYEEKVVMAVHDANMGSILGWGFAPFKGGTLQFINDFGLSNFISEARKLEADFGVRFSIPNLLLQMEADNELF